MPPCPQNVVFNSEEEALKAPSAVFSLSTCNDCGFSFNSDFNDKLIVYDMRYNNDVASPVFDDYYHTLAKMLIARFDLSGGHVFDVGCGSGRLLRILCKMSPGTRGIGIDPSCTPASEENLTLNP